jgi:hypothetical protein
LSRGVGDGDRCASCSISLPNNANTKHENDSFLKPRNEQVPFRTKDEAHVCGNIDVDSDDDEIHPHDTHSDSGCHSHIIEYISSSSPVDSEIFSSLRRATIRTLSGEQLPRGQTSGPLWFGDSLTGYTVAYVFRLADTHARGRQRYYALLALVGTDTRRAFEACTLIWTLFEQIAMHIINMAEEAVSSKKVKEEDERSDKELVTPISSFLTQRNLDPDGFPRRGVANVKANNIADLVDNSNFFCELHMMFVGMLQELGKILGGMKIRPGPSDTLVSTSNDGTRHMLATPDDVRNVGNNEEDDLKMSPAQSDADATKSIQQALQKYQLSSPSPLPPQMSQVVH